VHDLHSRGEIRGLDGRPGPVSDFVDNEVITRVRATENEIFIVVVNHAERFNGGSYAVGPGGEVIHQMDEKSAVAVVDLPLGIVPSHFHSKPLGWMGWGYRRPAVYKNYFVANEREDSESS
jgi:hypothetical protein